MTTETTNKVRSYSDYNDEAFFAYHIKQFQEDNFLDENFFVNQIKRNISKSLFEDELDICKSLKELNFSASIEHINHRKFYIYVNRGDFKKAIIFGSYSDYNGNAFLPAAKNCVLTLSVCGSYDSVYLISNTIGSPIKNTPSVKWYYISDGRTDYATIDIEQKYPVYDEMYPWVKGGLDKYFSDYMNSDSNILIMFGPAGVGKTSFVREFLIRKNLDAMITYEESLMQSDRLYMDLIVGEDDVLVVEDADLILLSREVHENKLMSKLLNISDGLLKNKKKIIFTANLERNKISDTDHALIRPGRCFDVLEFRDYTYEEAAKVSDILNIEKPKSNHNISLAKLTNTDYIEPKTQKIGFR